MVIFTQLRLQNEKSNNFHISSHKLIFQTTNLSLSSNNYLQNLQN